jgi:hypothetical protein
VKKGETYIVTNYAHLKNMRLYALRGPKLVLTQMYDNFIMGFSPTSC